MTQNTAVSPAPLRVGINGFGRIGRNTLRAWFEAEHCYPIEWIAVNDVADIETLALLFRYDSTHGRFKGDVTVKGQHLLLSAGDRSANILFTRHRLPEEIPWGEHKVDLVLECTGLFRSYDAASGHLQAGARRVNIGAAPFDHVDAAIVYGVNQQTLKPSDRIISSVSCTTQALVPLVKILDDHIGIENAMMTEVHAVTTDQSVLDHAHRDIHRGRSAGANIIPTTSSALGALKRVLPHMKDRIEGYSIRVPTQNVAAIDLSFVMKSFWQKEDINQLLKAEATHHTDIMAVTTDPVVSSDFNHQPQSLTVDLSQTMVTGRLAKVYAWYDNEWGYANRLLDICRCIYDMEQGSGVTQGQSVHA